jgi:Flp pilus assembly protein TadG
MGAFFKLHRLLKLGSGQKGSAAVEFALCLFPLLLIVGGILDYGHLWYMQSVLTTASREGARYATRYQTDPTTGVRLLPNALNPLVTDYITTNYAGLLPSDAKLTVTPGGAGYSTGTTGAQVSIQASANKSWFFLNYLIPGTTSPQPLSSKTVMTCE